MRFVVIDGLDAAGKDTQAQLLKENLEEKGEKVEIYSHPSSKCVFGSKAEEALLGNGRFSKARASFFFTLDVIDSILKSKNDVDTIIFVRYLCSVAYLPQPFVERSYKFFSSLFPTSPYMFFLDVEPKDAVNRIGKREKKQIFENEEDIKKVRKKVQNLLDDWHVIETSKPISQVQKEIEEIIEQ